MGSACPICGQTVRVGSRPFCSERCKQIDLGRWLNESYRLPGEEVPSEVEIIEMHRPDRRR